MSAFWHNLAAAPAFFQVAFALYLVALVLFVIGQATRRKGFTHAAVAVLAAAFVANTVVIAGRWIEAGRAPFKTLYETMVFYPWCVSLVFFVLYALYRLAVLGAFTALANLAGFAYACANPDIEVVNLPPALQSAWFVPHVITYFIAYAALFASFCLAVLYLIYPQWKREETGAGFEQFYARALDFGFVALTFGIVMGAMWGKVAWGDYWAWDPKENWALITWLAYLVSIHLRYLRGWRGERAAVVCIGGFAAAIFTYLGMSLLPTASGSLHVYQS